MLVLERAQGRARALEQAQERRRARAQRVVRRCARVASRGPTEPAPLRVAALLALVAVAAVVVHAFGAWYPPVL